MSETAMPLLVSVTSAARLMDCKPDKVRTMLRRGKLTKIDVDGMVRIPRAEIEAFVTCNIGLASIERSGAPSPATDEAKPVSRSVLRQQRAIGRMLSARSRGSTAA